MKGIGIRLAIIAAIALGAFLLRDRLSSNAGDLQAGDCFDVPTSPSETVDDVQHQPCSDPHTGEVVLVVDHTAPDDAPYPGDSEWDTFIGSNCVPAFNSYTGLDFDTEPTMGMGFFTPTDEGWEGGDRKVICYATRVDKAPMNQSIKAGGG